MSEFPPFTEIHFDGLDMNTDAKTSPAKPAIKKGQFFMNSGGAKVSKDGGSGHSGIRKTNMDLFSVLQKAKYKDRLNLTQLKNQMAFIDKEREFEEYQIKFRQGKIVDNLRQLQDLLGDGTTKKYAKKERGTVALRRDNKSLDMSSKLLPVLTPKSGARITFGNHKLSNIKDINQGFMNFQKHKRDQFDQILIQDDGKSSRPNESRIQSGKDNLNSISLFSSRSKLKSMFFQGDSSLYSKRRQKSQANQLTDKNETLRLNTKISMNNSPNASQISQASKSTIAQPKLNKSIALLPSLRQDKGGAVGLSSPKDNTLQRINKRLDQLKLEREENLRAKLRGLDTVFDMNDDGKIDASSPEDLMQMFGNVDSLYQLLTLQNYKELVKKEDILRMRYGNKQDLEDYFREKSDIITRNIVEEGEDVATQQMIKMEKIVKETDVDRDGRSYIEAAESEACSHRHSLVFGHESPKEIADRIIEMD